MDKYSYLAQFKHRGDVLYSENLEDAHKSYIKTNKGEILGIYIKHVTGGVCLTNNRIVTANPSEFIDIFPEFKYQWWLTKAIRDPESLKSLFGVPCYISTEKYIPLSKNNESELKLTKISNEPPFTLYGKYFQYDPTITEDIYNKLIKKLESYGWESFGDVSYDSFKHDKYLIYSCSSLDEKLYGTYSYDCLNPNDKLLDIKEFLNEKDVDLADNSQVKTKSSVNSSESISVINSTYSISKFDLHGKYFKYTPDITKELYTAFIKKLEKCGYMWGWWERTYAEFQKHGYITYVASMDKAFDTYPKNCIPDTDIQINIKEFLAENYLEIQSSTETVESTVYDVKINNSALNISKEYIPIKKINININY